MRAHVCVAEACGCHCYCLFLYIIVINIHRVPPSLQIQILCCGVFWQMIWDPPLIPQPLEACEGYGGWWGSAPFNVGPHPCSALLTFRVFRDWMVPSPLHSGSSAAEGQAHLLLAPRVSKPYRPPAAAGRRLDCASPLPPSFSSHRLGLPLAGGFCAWPWAFFRGRKCLLFHEVEIIFLIRDRKTGEPCAPLKRGPALRTARLRKDTIKGTFWEFERHFSHW